MSDAKFCQMLAAIFLAAAVLAAFARYFWPGALCAPEYWEMLWSCLSFGIVSMFWGLAGGMGGGLVGMVCFGLAGLILWAILGREKASRLGGSWVGWMYLPFVIVGFLVLTGPSFVSFAAALPWECSKIEAITWLLVTLSAFPLALAVLYAVQIIFEIMFASAV